MRFAYVRMAAFAAPYKHKPIIESLVGFCRINTTQSDGCRYCGLRRTATHAGKKADKPIVPTKLIRHRLKPPLGSSFSSRDFMCCYVSPIEPGLPFSAHLMSTSPITSMTMAPSSTDSCTPSPGV